MLVYQRVHHLKWIEMVDVGLSFGIIWFYVSRCTSMKRDYTDHAGLLQQILTIWQTRVAIGNP